MNNKKYTARIHVQTTVSQITSDVQQFTIEELGEIAALFKNITELKYLKITENDDPIIINPNFIVAIKVEFIGERPPKNS